MYSVESCAVVKFFAAWWLVMLMVVAVCDVTVQSSVYAVPLVLKIQEGRRGRGRKVYAGADVTARQINKYVGVNTVQRFPLLHPAPRSTSSIATQRYSIHASLPPS